MSNYYEVWNDFSCNLVKFWSWSVGNGTCYLCSSVDDSSKDSFDGKYKTRRNRV